VYGLEADGEERAGPAVREAGHAGGRAQRVARAWQAVHGEIVGGVDTSDGDLVRTRAPADGHQRGPLVADGKERVRGRAARSERVEIARVRLAEAGRVRHQPARVEVVLDGTNGDADEITGKRE